MPLLNYNDLSNEWNVMHKTTIVICFMDIVPYFETIMVLIKTLIIAWNNHYGYKHVIHMTYA